MPNPIPPEVIEVVKFLETIRPFDALSEEQIISAAQRSTISYHRAHSEEQILDYENPTLFVVRAGVFDVRDADGELIDRVSEGGCFGFISLLTGTATDHRLHIVEDGLLYRFDQDVFQFMRHNCIEFDQFFAQAFEQRLRVGLRKRNENGAWATRLNEVMADQLIYVAPDATIVAAAQVMTERDIASIAVVESEQLVGIFTDKDCRKRVIAAEANPQSAISTVMTPNPVTIEHTAMVHEATILMIRHQIKHLPVTIEGKARSIVTLSDLIRLQRSDPVLIISEIHRAHDVPELVSICQKIPELLLQLIKLDVRADDLGRILTSVTGALTRRLITLAQSKFGPEPVPFVWLAFGSQGRQDQSAKSDQDNGLLIDNSMQPEHDAYFKDLAEFVNHGLDACGYVYCPGDVMAQNSQWRQPLSQWLKVFTDWITQPSTKALMHASIFFDLRPIWVSSGAEDLTPQLQLPMLALARNNSIFLSLLTENALELTPPLGIMQRLKLDKTTIDIDADGTEHKRRTLDIKKRGMMPITDIARIHALANGIEAVNTRDRIEALIDQSAINKQDGHNLLDAHEYIAHQRLLHQGEQLKSSLPPDNDLDPAQFSPLTIRHLKDAFKVVRTSQAGLRQRFTLGAG